MEDGSSMPLWGLFVLLLLLWLNGIFYGFAAALRNISENDTQKKAEEGDKKAQMLMTLIDKPAQCSSLWSCGKPFYRGICNF